MRLYWTKKSVRLKNMSTNENIDVPKISRLNIIKMYTQLYSMKMYIMGCKN